MFWSIRRPNFSTPCSFSAIQTFSALKSACRLQAIIVQPMARCEAARRRLQIFRRNRECTAMRRGIPDQGATGLERRMQPFMRIERDGIGTLDPGDAIGILRRDGDERTDAAIDMEPEVFFLRQLGERLQIVDGAGVYRAGRCRSRRPADIPPRDPRRSPPAVPRCRCAVRHRSECAAAPGCPSPSASIALRWQL